jgi:hypothetical protein
MKRTFHQTAVALTLHIKLADIAGWLDEQTLSLVLGALAAETSSGV